MKRLVRFLLAAVVAAAVPLQGALAVTAAQCMALGHHQSAAAQHGDGKTVDAHDHAAHSHSQSDQGASEDESLGNGAHCGPCTACCASASISGPIAQSVLPSASGAPYVFSQFPPLGVQPHGLYRPPLAL